MAARYFFALLVFIALKEHCFSAPTLEEYDELSKRALERPSTVFRKLKSTFIKLGVSKGLRKSGSAKLDIVFVMDKSGSIGSRNFGLEKQFVSALVAFFPVFPTKTRVAIVSYSTNVKLEFNFNKYPNRECVRKKIKDIRYTGGLTATGDSLEYVRRSLIFNSAAGARSDAKKIIFVLTDGKSNRGVTPSVPANQMKRRGVIIFALGITASIKRSELLSIASGPSYVFHLRNYADLNQVTRLLESDISNQCYNGRTVYDQCGRRCKCVGGQLVQCCRLRKEFTAMTTAERIRYVNAVKTASTNPLYKQRYETLLTNHRTIFFSNIHELDFFLPWHRWFILQYENLLREIDCRVTVPYWDWSLVGANPFSSDVWNTGPQGFGGNGAGSQNCVNTGPFREAVWSLIAGGQCLRRDFGGGAPDAIAVENLISSYSAATQFFDFEFLLRRQYHDLVHCIIDGTMCTTDSAFAPEFFLHHGFIDKIWWDWQKLSNAHKFNTYFMTQTSIMTSTVYRSRNFLDLNNQPGCVCAEYVDPQSGIYKTIKGMSKAQIRRIPRLPLPTIPAKAMKLFRISAADRARVVRLKAAISPAIILDKSALKGTDATQGFRSTDISRRHAVKLPKAGRIRLKPQSPWSRG